MLYNINVEPLGMIPWNLGHHCLPAFSIIPLAFFWNPKQSNDKQGPTCPPLLLKRGFFFFNEKATSNDIRSCFFIKKLFFYLKKFAGAGKLAPNYHFPSKHACIVKGLQT
jgi:hypothetical protein